jgi:lipopolysaccharide export system permease protein
MRILERYLGIFFIVSFVAAVFIFLSLYIIIDLFSHLDEIIKNNLLISTLSSYYLSFIPKILTELAPVAALLSTVYTLSRLSKTNEITAMRAAGLSILQVTKIVLILGAVISCLVFFINERIVPISQKKILEIKLKQMNIQDKYLAQQPIKNAAIYGLDNKLFFIGLFNPKDHSVNNVIVFEQDEKQNILAKIVANSGQYKEGRWIFYDCITYKYGLENQLEGEPEYAQAKIMNFKDTPEDIERQQIQINYMNIQQLKDYRKRLERSNATAVLRSFDVEIQKRLAYPLSVIVLMFVSIPFSLSVRKKGQVIASLGVSIGLGFFYYVLNSVSIAFGKENILPVILSAWLANITFFILGIFLIKRLP